MGNNCCLTNSNIDLSETNSSVSKFVDSNIMIELINYKMKKLSIENIDFIKYLKIFLDSSTSSKALIILANANIKLFYFEKNSEKNIRYSNINYSESNCLFITKVHIELIKDIAEKTFQTNFTNVDLEIIMS